MAAASAARAPCIYLTHGGGPFPVIGGPGHAGLTKFLKAWPTSLPEPPKALLVVSGHWETAVPTVTSAPRPELIYDYHGFPPESYEINYPAPGDPQLADKVCSLLKAAGMECQKDAKRGFDHGTFIPLVLAFPKADIPVVQLSLAASLDPQLHIKMGEALAPLRDEGVAIIGSGSSFHNMPALFAAMGGMSEAGRAALQRSKTFDEWLQYVCTDPQLPYEKRAELLAGWRKAPEGQYSHPREEHLLPLHVCLGAGRGGAAKVVFDDLAMGVKCSSFQW
ncbi:dioxygenase [Micractinium conductrix]|uniref:Dioxygenase n=1 Tax=Micractinium conductrix TaxID=554055 RepID=A0A2P6VBV2_9CHLO|nr:dioxygenase [Micractinium conductrix]|eukprot:PSC71563.1 dioxygenase [Micractinium conductrix]